MKRVKTARQLERHLKGIGNHYRIEVLLLLRRQAGMMLEDIIEALGANEKTIGAHVRRLHQAGLVNKKYRSKFVEHTLSPYGKMCADFMVSFQRV